jgi:hypothetical protein
VRKLIVFCVGVLALGTTGPAAADVPAAPAEQTAVWQTKDLVFSYQGFTTRYTCDGLRDKLRQVLLLLGARDDLTVFPSGCLGEGRVNPYPAVQIHLTVLQPVSGAAPAGAMPAQWLPVNLIAFDALEDSDCELVQQIKDNLLPLFAVRAVDSQTNCVPHQASRGVRLKAEVLKPAAQHASSSR